jgi:hypothetical protein
MPILIYHTKNLNNKLKKNISQVKYKITKPGDQLIEMIDLNGNNIIHIETIETIETIDKIRMIK